MFCRIRLMGNLGKDSELHYRKDGTPILTFTLAVNYHRQRDGEWQQETIWHQITYMQKDAPELYPVLLKGQQVFVNGEMVKATAWKARDGSPRADIHVLAAHLDPILEHTTKSSRPHNVWG